MIQIILLSVIFGILTVAVLYLSKLNTISIIVFSVISSILGWYALSVNVEQVLALFYGSAYDPFASAEIIFTETHDGFLIRHVLESYGWAIGFLYFLLLLGIAYALKVKYGSKK